MNEASLNEDEPFLRRAQVLKISPLRVARLTATAAIAIAVGIFVIFVALTVDQAPRSPAIFILVAVPWILLNLSTIPMVVAYLRHPVVVRSDGMVSEICKPRMYWRRAAVIRLPHSALARANKSVECLQFDPPVDVQVGDETRKACGYVHFPWRLVSERDFRGFLSTVGSAGGRSA